MASVRRLRRQRNLNQIEIPEKHVTISDELLGKGRFGSVYIADYNGRNVAAKISALIASAEGKDIDVRFPTRAASSPHFPFRCNI